MCRTYLSQYLDQLNPSQISFAVKQCHPKNLHEAMSSTIELKSYLPKEQPLMQAVSESSEISLLVPVQVVQQQLFGAIKWVEKLEMKPPCDHEQYMRPPRKLQGRAGR